MAENSNVSPAALSAMQAVSDSMILARTARKKTQAEVASACSLDLLGLFLQGKGGGGV